MATFNNNHDNAAGNNNTQIWSVVGNGGDAIDESFWDDSDLLAEYAQVESVVKEKVIEKYAKTFSKSNNKFRRSNFNKKSSKPFTEVKIPSTKDDNQNEVADFVESETPNEQFTCNLNWIPPCVNPPEELFSQLPYSSEYSSFNAQPAYTSSQPVFGTEGANFPKIDPIARAWYDAGYRLGRLHALKLKATSSVKVSNS
ncbi:unnamed protein product [Trichobilharzia szidati]|nr:unnamed protein product [Trichobilharzia szidati]CAH8867203.1 unnamed protein product [Trichobilharzia szidati]